MRIVAAIVLLCAFSFASGQEMNFRQVDTTTYNQYLSGDWQALVKTGKEAAENGFDYYYLHMRIAYAYFSMNRYRQAIPWYLRALELNSKDPVAREYLYYCYQYSGRKLEALRQGDNLNDDIKSKLNIPDHGLTIAGVDYSNGMSPDLSGKIEEISAGIDPLADGIQKGTYSMSNTGIQLEHRLGENLLLSHGLNVMKKLEYSYFADITGNWESSEQPLSQTEYSVSMKIPLGGSFFINPGVHLLSTKIPIYEAGAYGPGSGRDRNIYSEITVRRYVPKFRVEKNTTWVDLALSYVYLNFNQINTNQVGGHIDIYPFGNLNFYLRLDGYMQLREYNAVRSNAFFLIPEIGARLHKNAWLEFRPLFMEHFNHYDERYSIAYNNAEMIKDGVTLRAIFPFYKVPVKIFLQYSRRHLNSYFFPADNMLEPVNQHTYEFNMITGGILWTR